MLSTSAMGAAAGSASCAEGRFRRKLHRDSNHRSRRGGIWRELCTRDEC
jgi:hypothetical protein